MALHLEKGGMNVMVHTSARLDITKRLMLNTERRDITTEFWKVPKDKSVGQ